MLLPIRCAICSRPGASPCKGCIGELHRAPPLPPPRGLVACHALLSYEGPARQLVAGIKYRNARGSLPWLASAMVAMVPWLVGESDLLVTWAPTTTVRRRQRGFDHAELLAAAVASGLGAPCRRGLQRVGTEVQTGHDRRERLAGPHFEAAPAAYPAGVTVVLVDDVLTTGSTLSAAARTACEAGAAQVVGLVAARTPPAWSGTG